MDTLFIPLSFVAGSLLAVQAGANAQLAKATGSPFTATTLQLIVGTVLLAVLALVTGTLTALATLPQIVWWHAIGGTASAFYVVSTILLFPRLGAVVSVGLIIAGQMFASLVLDTSGWLGVPARGLGFSTLAGTLGVLLGAAAVVFGQPGGPAATRPGPGWILLALAAGAVLPVQGAVNALLRQDLGAPLAVAAVSFLVATITMAGLSGLLLALRRQPPASPPPGLAAMPWWGWLGGFAGATYVTTLFTAIPVIGSATAVGLTVAGQQLASVLVDRHGWFRLAQRTVSGLRLAGVGLIITGVAVLKLA
ncbi:MAG: DMT family transporter [Rhizobiales bacterium]|nr:DMT family transporter [Hyphomicrobiales bacterium]